MSLASVVTRGYGLPGSLSLVVTQGYGTGGTVPIPPTPPADTTQPYGPALTPAQRARWFGLSFESPLARKKRRKLCERLAREAAGILEPEECEAILDDRISEEVGARALRADPANAPRPALEKHENPIVRAVVRDMAGEIRALVREQDEYDEKQEVIDILRELKKLH